MSIVGNIFLKQIITLYRLSLCTNTMQILYASHNNKQMVEGNFSLWSLIIIVQDPYIKIKPAVREQSVPIHV